MKVAVLSNQTLTDIAIQVYGSVEGVLTLAKANNISITDSLQAGRWLEVPEVTYVKRIAEFYKVRCICPATAEVTPSPIRIKVFTEQFTEQFK